MKARCHRARLIPALLVAATAAAAYLSCVYSRFEPFSEEISGASYMPRATWSRLRCQTSTTVLPDGRTSGASSESWRRPTADGLGFTALERGAVTSPVCGDQGKEWGDLILFVALCAPALGTTATAAALDAAPDVHITLIPESKLRDGNNVVTAIALEGTSASVATTYRAE